MPFNPTLPATNSEMSSAEMRDQFNGLKTLIDENIPTTEKGAANGVASLDASSLLVQSVDWSKLVNTPSLVLATGVAGGQTIIGGTAASNNLTLSSTSHATKGTVNVGTGAGNAVAIGNSS